MQTTLKSQNLVGSLLYKLSRRQKLSPLAEWWNMCFGNCAEKFIVWDHPKDL